MINKSMYLIGLLILAGLAFYIAREDQTEPEASTQVKVRLVERSKLPKPNETKLQETKEAPLPSEVTQVITESEVLVKSGNVTEKYFHDWADNEFILNNLYEEFGDSISQTFFQQRDKQAFLDESRNIPSDNKFMRHFKSGMYQGYFFLMKKDGSYGPDPQPFIIDLRKEKENSKTTIKATWIAKKKATGADGKPYPIWPNNYVSKFGNEEVYKNLIGFSEEALGPMFLSYFGMNHKCLEGTFLILSKVYKKEKIEGNFYCREGLHDFILIGLSNLTYIGE